MLVNLEIIAEKIPCGLKTYNLDREYVRRGKY